MKAGNSDKNELGQLLSIISKENLPVNLYHTHQLQEYEVVLEKNQGQYVVYATNERSGKQGIDFVFNSEQEALEDVILKSRILKMGPLWLHGRRKFFRRSVFWSLQL